jgi:hypothetical protein
MSAHAEALAAWEATEAAMQHARRLYPHNPALQSKWVEAIQTVRSTRKGYVLDRKVQRLQEPLQ